MPSRRTHRSAWRTWALSAGLAFLAAAAVYALGTASDADRGPWRIEFRVVDEAGHPIAGVPMSSPDGLDRPRRSDADGRLSFVSATRKPRLSIGPSEFDSFVDALVRRRFTARLVEFFDPFFRVDAGWFRRLEDARPDATGVVTLSRASLAIFRFRLAGLGDGWIDADLVDAADMSGPFAVTLRGTPGRAEIPLAPGVTAQVRARVFGWFTAIGDGFDLGPTSAGEHVLEIRPEPGRRFLRVRLEDAHGKRVAFERPGGHGAEARTEGGTAAGFAAPLLDGSLAFADARAGATYSVRIDLDGRGWGRAAGVRADDGEARVTIRSTPVRVRVVSSPVGRDLRVAARRAGDTSDRVVAAREADGTYRLASLSPGRWTVRAETDVRKGGKLLRAERDVAAGEDGAVEEVVVDFGG